MWQVDRINPITYKYIRVCHATSKPTDSHMYMNIHWHILACVCTYECLKNRITVICSIINVSVQCACHELCGVLIYKLHVRVYKCYTPRGFRIRLNTQTARTFSRQWSDYRHRLSKLHQLNTQTC